MASNARTSFSVVDRVNRLHQLFYEQQQSDNGVRPWITMAQLMAEFECTDRTIHATIARMCADYRLPVDYVVARGGYGYTEPVSSLPTVACTRGQSRALCFAMQGASPALGMPFAESGRTIIREMTSKLRREMAVEFEALEKIISFHATGADVKIPLEHFETVTPAALFHQELELEYGKPDPLLPPSSDGRRDAPEGLRRVEPLHIACIDFCWYLFAWDVAKDDLRTFALRRIRHLRMTGRTVSPRPFSIEDELASSFGAYPSGQRKALVTTVRLRLWGHAAQIIPELLWHRTQRFRVLPVEPGEPPALEMTMEVVVNPKLKGWVQQWLGEIAVLEPASLRQDVRAAALKAIDDLDRYTPTE